ncbi:type I-E CRISPR-associated protein Cas5/CasD [Actinokineospora sp. G85]|uniref:type I-E CRISPR-associated protein Cas5/CasD n=1 Tax=Actinokineospora sp. G85 TaxID=3406626 RepID=UPI003C72032F
MTALLLRFAGPLQAWGTGSRFSRRETDRVPSKSGVVGLLAAARGHHRAELDAGRAVDEIEALFNLRMGVRVDQPGRVERDFQTARTRDGKDAMPLSHRFYLSDAVFLVAVEGDRALLAGLREAVRRPAYPLALGRRSCPPVGKLEHGLRDGDVREVLTAEPWMASKRVMRRAGASERVALTLVVDCAADDALAVQVQDQPISFDPAHRRYGWRSVREESIEVLNPEWRQPTDKHDPFEFLESVS